MKKMNLIDDIGTSGLRIDPDVLDGMDINDTTGGSSCPSSREECITKPCEQNAKSKAPKDVRQNK